MMSTRPGSFVPLEALSRAGAAVKYDVKDDCEPSDLSSGMTSGSIGRT